MPVMLALLVTGSVAFAQDIDWAAITSWGENPVIFLASVASIVALIRGDPPRIHGKWNVGALSVVTGAVLGLLVAILFSIEVEPFSQFSTFPAGLSYGAIIGLSNFLGINLIDLLVKRIFTKPRQEAPQVIVPVTTGVKDPTIPNG